MDGEAAERRDDFGDNWGWEKDWAVKQLAVFLNLN